MLHNNKLKCWPVLAKRSTNAPQTNTQQLLTYTLQQAVVSRLILIAFNVTFRSFGTSISFMRNNLQVATISVKVF